MKKNTLKIKFISVLVLFFIMLLSCENKFQKVSDKKLPNVIVIMTDDLGYNDVGFNGSKEIPTPNIDRIAQKGVIFTNGYTPYHDTVYIEFYVDSCITKSTLVKVRTILCGEEEFNSISGD